MKVETYGRYMKWWHRLLGRRSTFVNLGGTYAVFYRQQWRDITKAEYEKGRR